MWTNRPVYTYCQVFGNGFHLPMDALACVCFTETNGQIMHDPVIQLLRVVGSTPTDVIACMSILLAHETVHTFDMEDVYDSPGHIEGDDNYNCIMDYYDEERALDFYQAVMSGNKEPFCDSCLTEIRNCVDSTIDSWRE